MIKRPKYHQGKYIDDPTALEVVGRCFVSNAIDDTTITSRFLKNYREWILSTENNQINGLEKFTISDFTQGCTESFTQFYLKHRHRRFRIHKGEYGSHLSHFQHLDWCWIEDEPLAFNDVVIISLPFANTGNDYLYRETMRVCSSLQIPVLVDCCWFGTCADINFDFSWPCIEQITFSLSKTFPVSRLRIGARFSRFNLNDGITDLNKVDYINRFSAFVGNTLLSNFSPDWLYDEYRFRQLSLCEKINVSPSSCVTLATSEDTKWKYLDRGGSVYRLCIADNLSLTTV